jgi:hypothetical protein
VERAGEGLGEECLSHAGGTHQEDVGLVDLDLVEDPLVVDPLVVVVDRHGQGSLRLLLADHVLVEDLLDLLGRGAGDQRFLGLALLLFGQNLVAE